MAAYHNGRGGGGKDQVGSLLAPVNGYRGALAAKGIAPRDHEAENRRALKDAQAKNRQKANEGAAARQNDNWKMKQFEGVQSKIGSEIRRAPGRQGEGRDRENRGGRDDDDSYDSGSGNRDAEGGGDGGAGREFLRRHTQEARPTPAAVREQQLKAKLKVESKRVPAQQLGRAQAPRGEGDSDSEGGGATPRKEAVPRAHEVNKLAPREARDHLSRNRKEATTNDARNKPQPKKPTDKAAGGLQAKTGAKHGDFGAVPDYIVERKERWAREEERRIANLPDPNCPPGMTLMAQEERLETLRGLKEKEATTREALMRQPLMATTLAAKKRKEALEQALADAESGIKIFSKEKVYVRE